MRRGRSLLERLSVENYPTVLPRPNAQLNTTPNFYYSFNYN